MGVIYGSAGSLYNTKKARSEFQKFLDLTTDEMFRVGAVYSPPELATSLRRFSNLDPDGKLEDLRLVVYGYMNRLKEKQSLFLMTPLKEIKKRETETTEELAKRNRTIRKAEAGIARCKDYIRTPSRKGHNLHNVKWQKIRQLERVIEREQKKVKALESELAQLAEAQKIN